MFLPQAFYHVKTTWIATPHLVDPYNVTNRGCLSASDVQPPVTPISLGVWACHIFEPLLCIWYDFCLRLKGLKETIVEFSRLQIVG